MKIIMNDGVVRECESKEEELHVLRHSEAHIMAQAIRRLFPEAIFAYGPATELLTLKNLCLPQFVIDGMNINGVYHHPTFFYESMACLFGFILMLIIRRYKNLKVGHISALYFITYGITRFFIEAMRQDSLMLGTFKVAQLVSLGLVVVGAILFNKLYNSKEK